MRALSLFSGCLGLDLGLELAGIEAVAYCENDPNCRRVIAERRPGVPLVGDVREIDESFALPVELVAAGFPCQPFSQAGRREGALDDRYLWPETIRAVRATRPGHVLLENVPGLATIRLDSGEPVFGRVLADLAETGYVGSWLRLRAADVGAPHLRERIFILAADTDSERHERRAEQRSGSARGRREPARSGAPTADAGRERRDGRRGADEGRAPRGRPDGRAEPEGHQASAPDTDSTRRERVGERPDQGNATKQADGDRAPHEPWWGAYGPAVRHWEQLLGRPAPRPTDDRGRLDPRFVEWMLGYPEGWVDVSAVSRTQQLRMLGNSVQVQVGRLAGELVLEAA